MTNFLALRAYSSKKILATALATTALPLALSPLPSPLPVRTDEVIATWKAPAVVSFNTPSATTFDDLIRQQLDQKHYVHSQPTSSVYSDAPCDPIHVPFDRKVDRECLAFLASAVAAVTHRNSTTIAYRGRNGTDFNFSFSVVPMQQKFEQRTIKFKMTFQDGALSLSCILKVPQILFPIEPFAEIAAYRIDRKLNIDRIPPTALLDVPIDWVHKISVERPVRDMPMIDEFLVASNVKTYDEWIQKDFVDFVNNERSRRYVASNTTVWCSVQLFMVEVQPVLSSPLKVPYSKSNPGWHRWFDVNFSQYPVPTPSLLALSELSVFDYIIRNNDRSPNKNNFIVGGCKHCAERRPSGLVPTFVHLDHGMSFYGASTHLVHNPLEKKGEKLKFCIFYRPQVVMLRRLQSQLMAETVGLTPTEVWERYLLSEMEPPVISCIGERRFRDCGGQVVKVLDRVDVCLRLHSEAVVLRPSNSTT